MFCAARLAPGPGFLPGEQGRRGGAVSQSKRAHTVTERHNGFRSVDLTPLF